jgi:hypothetical protein
MNFKPSQKSLELVRNIAETIPTFHHHYHLLYDIATEFFRPSYTITYLEIGTYKGASASLMLQRPNTDILSIDRLEVSSKEEIENNIKLFKNQKDTYFKLIIGDSNSDDTENTLVYFNQEKGIDILFIDGGHTSHDVINDFERYVKYLNKDGFIIFDDYNDEKHSPEVKKAVDYIVSTYLADSSQWVVMGNYNNQLQAHPAELKDGNCFVVRKIQ